MTAGGPERQPDTEAGSLVPSRECYPPSSPGVHGPCHEAPWSPLLHGASSPSSCWALRFSLARAATWGNSNNPRSIAEGVRGSGPGVGSALDVDLCLGRVWCDEIPGMA
jgi:hypothetical protein